MIPNVVGYNGFKSYGTQAYSNLKPGQTKLERQYYVNVNQQQGKNYLNNFDRFKSQYDGKLSKCVQPKDFQVKNIAVNSLLDYEYIHHPQHLAHGKSVGFKQASKRITQQQSTLQSTGANTLKRETPENKDQRLLFTTSHWRTTNEQNANTVMSTRFSRSTRPEWSLPKRPYICERGYYSSEYQKQLGKYGNVPSKLIKDDDSKLENQRHELTMGTTKVSKHIPGYGGFMPKVDYNKNAVDQSEGLNTRQTIIKQNIVENQNRRVPGYAGFLPASALNDRGTIRPHCFTTQGEQFH